MALSDMPAADRVPGWYDGAPGGGTTFPVTARDRLGNSTHQGFTKSDLANQAAARAAGVKRASQIDYDVALEAYEAREDIESLASRRAREYGTDYNAGEFMRELPNRSGGNGVAPDPNNHIELDFWDATSGNSSFVA